MSKKLIGHMLFEAGKSLLYLDEDLFTKIWIEVFNSAGSTFNHGDFTADNAFFWSSLDLSLYAGTDLGFTPYKIILVDGASKNALGYLAAVGAGETLGSELIGDPGFDNDAYWDKQSGWSVAGGKAIAINVPDGSLYATYPGIVGRLLKNSVSCDSISAGNYPMWVGGTLTEGGFTTTGVKILYGKDAVGAACGLYANILTATFTDISSKVVTDPPATAVHIVSSLNGTTRDWASIESGFNPNTIASWKIYG